MSRSVVWYRRACASASLFSLFAVAAVTTGNPEYWNFLGFLLFLLFLVPIRSASVPNACPLPQ